MRFNKTLHVTVNELPILMRWCDNRGIEYRTRDLKWPSTKLLNKSISMTVISEEQNLGLYALLDSLRKES